MHSSDFPKFIDDFLQATHHQGGLFNPKNQEITLYPDTIVFSNIAAAARASIAAKDSSTSESWIHTVFNIVPLDLRNILVEEILHSTQNTKARSILEWIFPRVQIAHLEVEASEAMLQNTHWLDLAEQALHFQYIEPIDYYIEMFEIVQTAIQNK
jgi:hypothetical protein